jgi:S-DNA-T family DNA segregation ATPase FtsK/SpoIIIE
MAKVKKERKSYWLAIQCLGVVVLLALFCSCLSFDIGDWPSRYVYPPNEPAANWCGVIGSFFAYYLLYYIGPGVFLLLVGAIGLIVTKMARGQVGQPVLRLIGLGLVTAAASSSFYYFWPHGVWHFPMGSGGIVGIGVTLFLTDHFALLGTFLLITATWLVGAILLADSVVMAALVATGLVIGRTAGMAGPALVAAKKRSEEMSEIWRKLSARQKAAPLTPLEASIAARQAQMDAAVEERIAEPKEAVAAAAAASAAPVDVKRNGDIKVTTAKAPKPGKAFVPESYDGYTLPPMELLDNAEYGYSAVQGKVVKSKAAALEKLLSEFNINAGVVAADTGPVVTMFELELGAGVKVSQISSLANDMARALSAGAVRVVAPLPGKHTIGIEVPNNEKEKVRLKDMLQMAGKKAGEMHIPLFLGKDASGQALISDLADMPHLLIAGTTGSGKSVCINSIITSILLMKRPDEVKMILVDPKMVEMTAFNTVPHLMSPIVTETNRAVQILEWATVKMDERYSLLAEAKVKNIAGYNKLGTEEIIARFEPTSADEEAMIPKKLPYIVIVIDELADLMMTAAKEIEAYIVRLAQKSRAVGIHIVLATQRPQATVVTGLIKSNMPCRIGFRVAARMDSRIILDQNGAETLLGQGDMLFLKPGTSDLVRAQGTFMDDAEIRRIVKYLKDIAEPQFHPELTQLGRANIADFSEDELFDDAVRIVLESKRGSVSLLQRRLSVGYARASRMIEMMAASGILGEYKGSQAREVMVTEDEYEKMCEEQEAMRGAATAQPQTQEAETGDDAQAEEAPEPAYVTEGQKEYAAVDDEQDEEFE